MNNSHTGWLKVCGERIRRGLHTFMYMLFCSWFTCSHGIEAVAQDSERWLSEWVLNRKEENVFIGAVASVISATTAQLLSNATRTDSVPWTVPAAYLISLSLSVVAVIIALHQTTFLNSTAYMDTDERVKKLLGTTPLAYHIAAWMYGMPHYVLIQAIFTMFVGIGITGFSPIWTERYREANDENWSHPQQVAIAVFIAFAWAIITFYASVAFQFSPRKAPQKPGRP